MSRADLLSLTPASVAALANLGLVKRAQREIESGKGPALAEDDSGVVTGTFEDGIVTKIPPGVPLPISYATLLPASSAAFDSSIMRGAVRFVKDRQCWHRSGHVGQHFAPHVLRSAEQQERARRCHGDKDRGDQAPDLG